MDTRIFKASEVTDTHSGWIADLSPAEAVDPDYYWYFKSKQQAKRFVEMVDAGVDPSEADYYITDLSTAAATMGRKGGGARTPAKQKASRENGKLGGRPKNIS